MSKQPKAPLAKASPVFGDQAFLDAFLKVARSASSDSASALKALQKSGIVTGKGKLTKPYREL
ncbi:MAG: hypothetical protein PW843_06705 [Azospirillaceae bacterium]|nr:hypothetical protein [Azospirillaceae bacterium]